MTQQATLLEDPAPEKTFAYKMYSPPDPPWVAPDIASAILAGPPDAWPWTLYREDGTPVTFESPAELQGATIEETDAGNGRVG